MKAKPSVKAIVTGAASGMGEAVARSLAFQGLSVMLLDKNIEGANRLAKEINGVAFECDVSNAVEVEAIFTDIAQREGELRVAINCAGIAPAKRCVGREGPMPLTDFERVIKVNLIGTFNIIRMSAALMMRAKPINQERGVIINTASIAAYEGQIGQAAYSASKGGIVSMTLPLAREFASQGIRVNTIAPGLIGTPLLLGMPQEVQDSLAGTVPFPKRFGTPEEFASLVSHIIDNPIINGETIRLDGGLRLREK